MREKASHPVRRGADAQEGRRLAEAPGWTVTRPGGARRPLAPAVLVAAAVLALLLAAPGGPARADLYKWEDSRGVLHITDDLTRVPESKRHGMTVYRIRKEERTPPREKPVFIPPTTAPERGPRLYGGHTLQWWKDAFEKLTSERERLRDEIEKKRQFIAVFEGGRRFGQMFGEAEVAAYKRYKKELPKEREELTKVEEELAGLRKKARIEEVPREVYAE